MRVLEDVVAEHDDDRLAGGEILRHADDLGDTARPCLHLVREIELEKRRFATSHGEMTVAEQVDHLTGVTLPGDEENLANPGELEELERVVDHRPSAHGEQVLVRDPGQLAEPRCLSSCADQSLHAAMLTGSGRVRGVRRSFRDRAAPEEPEGELYRRPDSEGERQGANADRPAERETEDGDRDFDRGPCHADAHP